jgi:hypothetical protein
MDTANLDRYGDRAPAPSMRAVATHSAEFAERDARAFGIGAKKRAFFSVTVTR